MPYGAYKTTTKKTTLLKETTPVCLSRHHYNKFFNLLLVGDRTLGFPVFGAKRKDKQLHGKKNKKYFGAFLADTGVFRLSWKLEEVPMVMGGGGAVRPAGGSAHPHPLAAQMRHDFSQQEPGTRNQEPVLH